MRALQSPKRIALRVLSVSAPPLFAAVLAATVGACSGAAEGGAAHGAPGPSTATSDGGGGPATTENADGGPAQIDPGPASAGDASSPSKPASGADAAPPPDPSGVPVLHTGAITGATTAEEAMIHDGVALANDTMKTACFKSFVLAASWTETNGLTQPQIWDKLCSGPITVDADMYTGSWYENNVSRTVGYENEPGVVHMNRYFVDSAYMVADNLIHEAEGHSQGFHHYDVKATSVPYGLNAAFEACSPVAP